MRIMRAAPRAQASLAADQRGLHGSARHLRVRVIRAHPRHAGRLLFLFRRCTPTLTFSFFFDAQSGWPPRRQRWESSAHLLSGEELPPIQSLSPLVSRRLIAALRWLMGTNHLRSGLGLARAENGSLGANGN